ncbi:uncharacterized protein LOC105434108 isoform X2 [Pogonomyrmex barbatus]|uniref:Uncharacterized protein LOC105434108 isoform X2 n=1 Tax=Pogonomyrmex barbatus TaxID=144034 RepID=A0A6I9WUT5_9HYME|nr:uncharacterized protein LOC105434108 isoform X2 [Pogonomyrmex barbatus]
MDGLICNKCFTPMYRGKQPYSITQCGHVCCQNCLQRVEKQCPQCERVDTVSLPLTEPLLPKLAPYFQPFAESLEMLLKVEMFRNTQMKILMQRFHDLDKKYEVLKTRYWTKCRNLQTLTEKYINLKAEKEKSDKKLRFSEIQRKTPQSSYRIMSTPTDSGISELPSSAGYSLKSEFLRPTNVTSMQSTDQNTAYRTVDGFLVPVKYNHYKSLKPNFLNMS